MNEFEFREHVKNALRTLDSEVEASITRELRDVSDLGHSERLQFEVQPSDFSIRLIQTEEEVLSCDSIDDSITFEALDRAEENGVDWQECISDELVAWFGDRWVAVNGPSRFTPAYIYFHGGLDADRFDLEQRKWLSVNQVWPDNTT